jgi:hypothetical protein
MVSKGVGRFAAHRRREVKGKKFEAFPTGENDKSQAMREAEEEKQNRG